MASAVSPVMPWRAMPARSFSSTAFIARSERLKPKARRKLLRLAAGEPRGGHGHPEQLLLEERHAERAREDGLEGGMRHRHLLPPRAAPEIGMHHVAHDGAGADDGHLHHEIVEALGAQARERRHLGAALDLEDADGVRLLEHGVHRGIVGRQMGEVDGAAAPPDHRERVLEERHHAEAEQVHLDDAEGGAVVLVPLDHRAPGHGRGLERHHRVEPSLADHHASRVLAEMPREVLDGRPQPARNAGCADRPDRSRPRRDAR